MIQALEKLKRVLQTHPEIPYSKLFDREEVADLREDVRRHRDILKRAFPRVRLKPGHYCRSCKNKTISSLLFKKPKPYTAESLKEHNWNKRLSSNSDVLDGFCTHPGCTYDFWASLCALEPDIGRDASLIGIKPVWTDQKPRSCPFCGELGIKGLFRGSTGMGGQCSKCRKFVDVPHMILDQLDHELKPTLELFEKELKRLAEYERFLTGILEQISLEEFCDNVSTDIRSEDTLPDAFKWPEGSHDV